MRKLAIVLAALMLMGIAYAATAFAQAPTPPQDQGYGNCGGAAGSYDAANSPVLKRLADKIGVSAQDLASELQAGKSVVDVAKSKNVEERALVELLQAPRAEMMAVMVKYGYLTQEQVDAMVKAMAESTKATLEQKGLAGGFGGMMGGFGGMMGGTTDYSGMMGGSYSGMMGGGYGGMMGRLSQN